MPALHRGLNLTTTPRYSGLSGEKYQQQLAGKQVGLPLGICREMNRMVPGSQHHKEPGNNSISLRYLVEGHLSPFRGDFPKKMSAQRGTDQSMNLQWFLVGRREMSIYKPTWGLDLR
jgi:hypothetical protein